MNKELQRGIVEELMRPIVLVGTVVGKVYKILFGWYDVKLSKKNEDQLSQDISREVSFLLNEYNGRIVPDESIKHPRGFDYAVVIVALDDLFFRFIRGRGDLRVQVASGQPSDWSELSSVLRAINAPGWERPLPSLSDVAEALKPYVDRIREAFSAGRRLQTEAHLSEMRNCERVVAKQLETEINRRLYPDR